MTLRSRLATSIGKSTLWLLKSFTNGGSSLPGKLALNLDSDILDYLSKNYDIAIITGTNGKTLTTALSVAVLNDYYPGVVTNPTGSNMQQGIVSTFLEAPHHNKKGIAILEVDEGSLKHVVKHLKPKLFVHTNVFRDQMDRYGEIYTIYNLMAEAAKEVPEATVIANGDSPILNSIKLPNPRLFYGFDTKISDSKIPHANTDGILCPHCQNILKYQSITYANQGDYFCTDCYYRRPNLDYRITSIDELTLAGSTFHIDNHVFHIPVAGLYNIYNALAAYSVARFFDISPEQIATSFEKAHRVFGRQEKLTINDKEVLINLVKNPVGLNQVIDIVALDPEPITLIVLLNNDYADGTDVSWIWDGDFEKMQSFQIEQALVGGMRKEDMVKRLTIAGINQGNIQIIDPLESTIDAIINSPTNHVHILATYTAMLQLRKELINKNYLKGSNTK